MKTLKTLLVVLMAVFATGAFAQNVLDGVYIKEHTPKRKFIPYTHLREADVMWSKRIWRTIDLREKINHPLYYPVTPINDRKSLFDVIKAALMNGNLTAYDNPVQDDEFKVAMTKSQVEALFIKIDTVLVEDLANPGNFTPQVQKNDMLSSDVKQFYVKEDWFFDKQKSVLEARIVGIAPLKESKNEQGEVRGYIPMFWIYYPEARPIFANSEVYNRKNDAERRTHEDIFWKRQFSSFIHKESNVYDRFLAEYKVGIDLLLEGERIKQDIFNLEHDLWHF